MDKKPGYLQTGDYWPEHSGYLVGNRTGLENLRQAIDTAIEQGEANSQHLDEFIGVRMLATSIFEDDERDEEKGNGTWGCIFLIVIVLLIIGIFLAGLYTIATTLLALL